MRVPRCPVHRRWTLPHTLLKTTGAHGGRMNVRAMAATTARLTAVFLALVPDPGSTHTTEIGPCLAIFENIPSEGTAQLRRECTPSATRAYCQWPYTKHYRSQPRSVLSAFATLTSTLFRWELQRRMLQIVGKNVPPETSRADLATAIYNVRNFVPVESSIWL